LAGALEAMGDLEGARAELAALSASARGTTPGLGMRVAAVLAKLGRKQEALTAYQTEIAAGGVPPAIKVAAARLALELGRKDEARKLGEAAVADDPRTPGALLLLAELRRLEGDLPHALLELRRALSVDGSAEVNLEYGRALAALGRNEEALAALGQAHELPEAGVERGRLLLRRGDVEGAARELATASISLPGNAEAQLLLGMAEERLGHATRAEAAFKAAVRLAPASAEARYRLGKATYDRGQPAAALPQLRAAAEHVPTVPDPTATWRAELYFNLGFAEARAGTRDRAATAFRKYLDLAPPDAPARAEAAKQLKSLD
jgi:Tfp pilus assembly protein PilF